MNNITLKAGEESLQAKPITARVYYELSKHLDESGDIPMEAHARIMGLVFGKDGDYLLDHADPADYDFALMQVRREVNAIIRRVTERLKDLTKNEDAPA